MTDGLTAPGMSPTGGVLHLPNKDLRSPEVVASILCSRKPYVLVWMSSVLRGYCFKGEGAG